MPTYTPPTTASTWSEGDQYSQLTSIVMTADDGIGFEKAVVCMRISLHEPHFPHGGNSYDQSTRSSIK